ncbi:hypothetical protein [Streptomyces xanthophaeus]
MPPRGARGVEMPGEDVVPPGPHRELVTELHRLYLLAGPPGLRKISDEIKDSDDFDATLNRNLIARILGGATLPTSLQLDSLTRYFISLGIDSVDPRDESRRLAEIWMRAKYHLTPPPTPTHAIRPFNSFTPIEQALHAASSTGSPEPLIEACSNVAPSRVLAVLDELKKRHWVAFTKAVRKSLGETFSAANIPSLLAELRIKDGEHWTGDSVLHRFAEVRAVPEIVELVRLLNATGQTGDVITIFESSFTRANGMEIAQLYCEAAQMDIFPWTFEDNRARKGVSTKKLVEFITNLTEIGYPEIGPPAAHQWMRTSTFRGINLAIELERAGSSTQADALLKEALRVGGMTQPRRYLNSDDVSPDNKQDFIILMKRNKEPIERPPDPDSIFRNVKWD